jgi:hypothetical protein
MKILSIKDRISLKYKDQEAQEEIEIVIRPLTVAQKMDISSKTRMVKGEEVADFQQQAYLCIKYAVVDVIGLTDSADQPYAVTTNIDGLDDDTTDDLIEFMSQKNLLSSVYYAANKMLDKVDGVEVNVLPKK